MLNWLILQAHRTTLALILLAVFHFLLSMMLWSLYTTVHRGPGAVGETLTRASSVGAEDRDLEAHDDGLSTLQVAENAPLMESVHQSSNMDSSTTVDAISNKPARRRRNTRVPANRNYDNPYADASGSEDENGYITETESRALNPGGGSSSSEDLNDSDREDFINDNDSEDGDDDDKKPVEIIFPSKIAGGTLMAKANGRARFCRKVCGARACGTP